MEEFFKANNSLDDFDFNDPEEIARYCQEQLGDDPNSLYAPFVWEEFISSKEKRVSLFMLF